MNFCALLEQICRGNVSWEGRNVSEGRSQSCPLWRAGNRTPVQTGTLPLHIIIIIIIIMFVAGTFPWTLFSSYFSCLDPNVYWQGQFNEERPDSTLGWSKICFSNSEISNKIHLAKRKFFPPALLILNKGPNGHFSKVGITQSQIQWNPTAWWSKHRNSNPWLVFSPGLPHSADFWAEFSPIFQPAPIRAMIRPGAMGLN